MTGARESPHANPCGARRRSHERPTAGPPSVGANGRRTPSRERCQSLGISTTAFELLPKAVRNTLQLLLLSADLASRFLLRVMAAAPGDRPAPPPLPKRRRGKAGAKRRPPEATPGSVLDLVACAPRARHDCLDSGACLARYDRHPRRRLCVMQHSVKQCSATDLIPEHNCSYTLSNCHVKQFTFFFIFSYHESSSLYLISSPFLVIYKDLPLFFVLVKYL